ncbi:MAG TPA: aminopeptidase [Actinomycetota bacterium]|nr:aminopeptidase [Actinomycetota bacterium]
MSKELEQAVRTVLVDCLAVESGENVLVVTDPPKVALARALVDGARSMGAEVVVAEMSERVTQGTEPPPQIAAAMLAADVVIAPTTKSLSHTEARHAASEKGARIATMPGVTEEMLGRTMSADFKAIAERSAAIASLLSEGSVVHITTEKGTDVTFDIRGREGLADDGGIQAPGAFGNLPAGEAFVAPVERKTNGRIAFDGSIWPVGVLEDPLVIDIEDGYARGFSGSAAEEFRSKLEPWGDEAFAVAELGIGTNEAAQLTGNVLEDEKILGTIHVAFGDNHSFGGKIRVASHQDGIVLKPTVVIDESPLLTAGRMLI